MWQRNDTGHVVDVAAHPTDDDPGRHPFTVGPGEVMDFPELLAGFTATEPPEPEPAESGDAEESASAAKTTRKRAEKAPAPEGVEP